MGCEDLAATWQEKCADGHELGVGPCPHRGRQTPKTSGSQSVYSLVLDSLKSPKTLRMCLRVLEADGV